MIDGVEELADVHVQYPVHRLALDSYNQGIERVVRTATGLISIREPQEIGFVDGIEHRHHRLLDDLVFQALGALTLVSVRRTPHEALFKGLMAAYHYLGYTQPVGEHLKFLVYAGTRPVALGAWSSAPRHLGPRDRFLGWSPAVRRQNIGGIAYNTRFLILPWVQVPHLASHVLSRMTRALPQAWQEAYGHPVYWAETFVDTTRYRGTCYRAANWQVLGQTQGRGKDDRAHQANRSIKDVWGLPLCRDYRARLLQTP